jgi:hypothetical protein
MDDKLVARMKEDRGWLASIMSKVPGFRGYLENTTIWEADGMVRKELARRLTEAKDPVHKALRAAEGDVRKGSAITALEGLLQRLDGAGNRVRVADYGHSALTAKIKIGEEDLARLLAFDRSLFTGLEAIEGAAATVAAEPQKLESAVQAFEDAFARRKQCLVDAAGRAGKE